MSTDIWTSYAAGIMVISIIPFVIVQLPQVFPTTSDSSLPVLISLIVAICFVIAYSIYQVPAALYSKKSVSIMEQFENDYLQLPNTMFLVLVFHLIHLT